MKEFALWLATTRPSVFIQEHYAWTIPTLQTIHILGIALVMGSVLMINLARGNDQLEWLHFEAMHPTFLVSAVKK